MPVYINGREQAHASFVFTREPVLAEEVNGFTVYEPGPFSVSVSTVVYDDDPLVAEVSPDGTAMFHISEGSTDLLIEARCVAICRDDAGLLIYDFES